MLEYLFGRMARMIPVIFLLSFIVFSMMHLLPGDPATLMLSEGAAASKEAVEALREQLGLNDPLHVQYWRFLKRPFRRCWDELKRSSPNGESRTLPTPRTRSPPPSKAIAG